MELPQPRPFKTEGNTIITNFTISNKYYKIVNFLQDFRIVFFFFFRLLRF